MSDDELNSALQALLDVERAASGPSAAAKARVLERLEGTLGLSGGTGGSDGGGGSSGSSGSSAASSANGTSGAASSASASSAGILPLSPLLGGKLALGGGLLALVGLVVGVSVGVLQGERELSSTNSAPAERVLAERTLENADSSERVEREPPASDDAAEGATDDASEGFVIDEDAVRVRSEPARGQAPERRARPSTLADEQPLLDEARAALSRGDAHAANAALREHAEAFPRGQLAEERSALLVLALARAGRHDEAERAAASFRARWPESLHIATVEAALTER